MTVPALVKKQDMLRAAEVAKSTGCRVEIKIGDAVVTLYPDSGSAPAAPTARRMDGIDYSPLDL